jgi:uncharacterized repeat protein (TIGR01451 family)
MTACIGISPGTLDAVGTAAYTVLTNQVKVYAQNTSQTNFDQSSNITVAAIHGVVESVDTNSPGILLPRTSKMFRFSLTNRANRIETNLVLILTNYQTNKFCGVWGLDLYAEGVRTVRTNSGFSAFSSFRSSLTNRVSPGAVFSYGLEVTAASNPDPECSVGLALIARVATNAVRYAVGGTAYGGRTNIVNVIAASVNLPRIILTKSVSDLSNVRFGGHGLTPGCEITYRISFSNSGNGPGRNLRIFDILPARFVEVETIPLSGLSGFATNMIQTYSMSATGGTWTVLPSGAWNSNIRRIQWFTGSELIPPGGTGAIEYKVRTR